MPQIWKGNQLSEKSSGMERGWEKEQPICSKMERNFLSKGKRKQYFIIRGRNECFWMVFNLDWGEKGGLGQAFEITFETFLGQPRFTR